MKKSLIIIGGTGATLSHGLTQLILSKPEFKDVSIVHADSSKTAEELQKENPDAVIITSEQKEKLVNTPDFAESLKALEGCKEIFMLRKGEDIDWVPPCGGKQQKFRFDGKAKRR
jgi:hypothetical protein